MRRYADLFKTNFFTAKSFRKIFLIKRNIFMVEQENLKIYVITDRES